jgi:ubiquinol-cytochrome c reductase cytochrome b subunit
MAGGLSRQQLRALARGDPIERPDPRFRAHLDSFWLHIRPTYYHEAATRFTHTFRLGLLSTYFFFVECVTGILLMFYYTPSPDQAYEDIQHLMSGVPFGQLLRDIHRLAAEAMIVAVALHLARTFLTGSYKKPRQYTWVTGVALLLATLLVTFTGYPLVWDQVAYWAATVGSGLVALVPPTVVGSALQSVLFGGPTIGADGLLRLYLLHILFLPGIILALFAVHYRRVVRMGLSLPASEETIGEDTARRVPVSRRRYYLPDVFIGELSFVMVVTCVLLAVVLFKIYPGAPLAGHADPLQTPAHIQAPWFFLWVQGLLKLGNPTLMGVVLPLLFVGLVFAVPYVDRNPSRRVRDRRVAVGLFALASAALVVLTWMGTARFGVSPSPASQVMAAIVPPADEGSGMLQRIPPRAITVGEWDTRTYETSPASPEVRTLMARFADAIAREDAAARARGLPGLPGAYGKLIVEGWQPGLKKGIVRLVWQAEDGTEQVLERSTFLRGTGNPDW